MTETELMLTSIRRCRRVDLYVDRSPLAPEEERLFHSMQERRAAGEPLQYILGSTEFCGLNFVVDERVLIPRPETEILVEAAAVLLNAKDKTLSPLKILDLGTGSGNIAVSLAKCLPEALVSAVDVSADSLNVAQTNARIHHVESRVSFFRRSMLNVLDDVDLTEPERFDALVTNPPYIPRHQLSLLPTDVKQEPLGALDGGEDGLTFIRPLIQRGAALLKTDGFLMMEIGDGQAGAVAELSRRASWAQRFFINDYRGTERILVLCKDAGVSVKIFGLLNVQSI